VICSAWQAWQQPRWGPTQAMRATALGEALLAEMGGLKIAMAEAAPAAPPVAQNFSGTWEKVPELSFGYFMLPRWRHLVHSGRSCCCCPRKP
jgi:hypothetical protein